MKQSVITLLLLVFPLTALFANFTGRVTSGRDAVVGVAISNGYDVVATDSEGSYTLPFRENARFITIALPAGYSVPEDYNIATPWMEIKSGRTKYDFSLRKLKKESDDFTFFVTTDIALYSEYNVRTWENNMATDMAELNRNGYKGEELYGFVLGDMIWTNEDRFSNFKAAAAIPMMPFFTIIGDYDHNREAGDPAFAKERYQKNLGPLYYAFNRGQFYFIVLDDILWQGTNKYVGSVDADQMAWLEAYLEYVPAGSKLVVAAHIPLLRRSNTPNNLINSAKLLELFKPYDVHVLSGHLRYMENYAQRGIYQHIHPAACGVANQFDMNRDGTPNGYTVYEFRGGKVSWYYKSLKQDRSVQFSVSPRGSHPEYADCVVVNVWNWDEKWRVEWSENGGVAQEAERIIDFPVEYKYGVYVEQSDPLKAPIKVYHLFTIKPSESASGITVTATDPFGNVYSQQLTRF